MVENERNNFKWQTRQDKTRQDKLRYVKNGNFLGIFDNRRGITLISLVITIIIMAILCKALHNIAYAKLKIMQSWKEKSFKISPFQMLNFA